MGIHSRARPTIASLLVLTLIDDKSWFCTLYLLKRKSGAFHKIQNLVAFTENNLES